MKAANEYRLEVTNKELGKELRDGTAVARSMSHRMSTRCEEFARASAFAVFLLIALALTAACGKNATTTSPTSTTTASDSVTETFTGTLPVGGSAFYSFSIATAGTVTATLTSIGGDGVPSSVMVNLGIGTLSAFTCSASSTSVQMSGTAQVPAEVSSAEQPGVFCVVISDLGNLFAPATFTVTIDHPLKSS